MSRSRAPLEVTDYHYLQDSTNRRLSREQMIKALQAFPKGATMEDLLTHKDSPLVVLTEIGATPRAEGFTLSNWITTAQSSMSNLPVVERTTREVVSSIPAHEASKRLSSIRTSYQKMLMAMQDSGLVTCRDGKSAANANIAIWGLNAEASSEPHDANGEAPKTAKRRPRDN